MFYIGFIFRKNKGKIGAILWEYWLSFEILHLIMWFLFYIGSVFRKIKVKSMQSCGICSFLLKNTSFNNEFFVLYRFFLGKIKVKSMKFCGRVSGMHTFENPSSIDEGFLL
ncbi:hypothetical protein FLJC2902T_30650 [Flavobacterium limnosediminis JC2902]|uniref:Uncharacterized protein n=1 Tax=Flavobacterium limnosediminis JC2902 TaxID=1341181 RepID=V6SMM4_9FLAO|nr:hypothetical protein FLJC2902T_30650 [Flavobacterium limnosediminis JC2902]